VERFFVNLIFFSQAGQAGRGKMRACFLGQNICSLGFGIATLQAPPLVMDTPIPQDEPQPEPQTEPATGWRRPTVFGPPPVANPPRPVP